MSHTDYLLLPYLRVQNANAISGPFTHGFPSITAFMGLMWALERKCAASGLEIAFKNVGVIAHRTQELIAGEGYGAKVFHQLRRPVRKTGDSAPMQEEGRMHLEFSLIFGLKIKKSLEAPEREEIARKILEILENMRFAGGIFLSPALPGAAPLHKRTPCLVGKQGFAKRWSREKYRFLPGFALIERPELLSQRLEVLKTDVSANPSVLEAFLSLCAFNYQAHEIEAGKVEWRHDRQKGFGWIVPLSVGYGAIGPLHPAGSVAAARDKKTPFQAVESLQSIGEWRAPHHFESVEAILWQAESDPKKGFYRCRPVSTLSEEIEMVLDEDGNLDFDD